MIIQNATVCDIHGEYNADVKIEKGVIKEIGNNLSDDEIIKYFSYDNMVKNELDFCPLYKDNKKCHNIED